MTGASAAAPAVAPARSTPVVVALGVWLLAAFTLGATGRVAALTPPQPHLVLVALTALVLVARYKVGFVRAWADTVDVRVLVSLHLTRFVGIWFLGFLSQLVRFQFFSKWSTGSVKWLLPNTTI
jgi:hypothetical protein